MKIGTFFHEIQGLRAVAVVSVIINHLNEKLLNSGFLGVDIFFVISGFVITHSLSRSINTNTRSALIDFYSRRVKRLLPALALCVVCSSLFASFFNANATETLRTGFFSLFGLSNIYLYYKSTDYFGTAAELNYFTHTWSLGVEEQFYLLFPIFFLILIKGSHRLLIYSMTILVIVSFTGFVYFSLTSPNVSFYLSPFRFWELGCGVLTYIVFTRNPKIINLIGSFSDNFILLLMVLLLMAPKDYAVITTPIVVLLTCRLLATTITSRDNSPVLTSRVIIYIGTISYSLYLWHWSLLALVKWTVGLSAVAMLALPVVILIFSSASYHFVEKPVLEKNFHHSGVTQIVTAIVLSLVTGYGILNLVNESNISRVFLGEITALTDNSTSSRLFDFDLQNAENRNSREIKAKCNMSPHRYHGAMYQRKPDVNSDFLSQCFSSEKQKIVLLGDSYSSVLIEHVQAAATAIDYEFRLLFGFGCPYPLVKSEIGYASSTPCEVDAEIIQATLEEHLNQGDIVVLSLFYQNSQYIQLSEENLVSSVTSYDQQLNSLVEILNRKQAGLLLVGVNGVLHHNVCFNQNWFNRLQCPQSETLYFSFVESIENRFASLFNSHLLNNIAVKNNNIEFVNPLDHLCNENLTRCLLRDKDSRYMMDDVHLSHAAVDFFYPAILENLLNISGSVSSR